MDKPSITETEQDLLMRAWFQYAQDANLKRNTQARAKAMVAFFSGAQALAQMQGKELGPRIVAPIMLGGREPQPKA